jgi:hypothetical protein
LQERVSILTLNPQQFQRMAQETTSYAHLQDTIGADRAAEVVRLVYEKRVKETNPDGRYVLITGGSLAPERASLDDILATECRLIAEKQAYVHELLAEALSGKLRQRLGTDDDLARGFSPELGICEATAWICRTLHGGREDEVCALLAEHAVAPRGEGPLGPTPALIDGLHARIFPEAPAARGPVSSAAYPSSVGGRHLLERIFARTAAALWPLPGDIAWLDVALFFMAAIGTVQGFADGNKRAARIAYALILLRGRRGVVTPTPELEYDLFRMRGTPGT